MIAEQLTRPSLQADVVAILVEADPRRSDALSALLWRAGIRIKGDLGRVTRLLRTPGLLETMRYFAASVNEDPELLARSVERSAAATPAEHPELHATATYAIGRPAIMRWITANPDRVVASDPWLAVLPGLGAVTKSVPLAEQALEGLIRQRVRLSRDLTAYIQLNPWFSQRFAIRYRRRMKGRRIRLYERAATARGWSHARTILMTQLPTDWQALLKRGEGRPLDVWSHELLTGYTETIERYSPDGVTPVVAPLYTIARAGLGGGSANIDLIRGWDVLPAETQ